MSEGRALIEKGSRSFDAAELLLARGDADFAASRTYYACFYVAEALLLSEGLTLSTHAGVYRGVWTAIRENEAPSSALSSATEPLIPSPPIRRLRY